MKITVTTHVLPRHADGPCADACDARVERETVIAVLADGAGAARGGAEAAQRAVKSIAANFAARPSEWNTTRALVEFATLINRTLHQDSLARFGSPELVSTLACVAIDGHRLAGLNVGDSRIYLHRDGQLEQLSEDHVDAAQSHVLQRALGLAPDIAPHVFERDLRDGDLLLLCSDGVTQILPEKTIARELGHRISARTLIRAAHHQAQNAEVDDMSAVVIDVARVGRMRAVSQIPLLIPDHLTKGQVIDGYELLRPFTATDRVWLAAKDGQRWAMKFAPVDARDNETVLEAFVREAWNAGRIEGDPFVTAFTPDDASARYYLQEFVEAPSLKALLGSRPLAVDEAVRLGRFLCDAASRLLALDLMHGDLKPENVLAVADYDQVRFKLIDFGSSAEIFSVASRAGTSSYLAPERFTGAPISERTEIFAIGVTLYEALTRRFPFGEIERFQTPAFHPPKRPSALNPHLPAWLDHVILRALSIDPAQRYQHYSALAFDLANPERVEPFYQPGAPLLERDPLAFYRAGFWLLLAATLFLLFRLLTH